MHLTDLEDPEIDSETCPRIEIDLQNRLDYEFGNNELRSDQQWDWMINSARGNEKIDVAVGEKFHSISYMEMNRMKLCFQNLIVKFGNDITEMQLIV